MVTVACIFFLLSTIHAIVDLIRLNLGLVVLRDTFPKGPVGFFADPAQEIFLLKSSLYLAETLLADGVVIYCSYRVWKSFWIVLLPLLLWAGTFATGAGALYELQLATNTGSQAKIFSFAQWITSLFAASLATNIVATTLLVLRIWSISKTASQYRVGVSPVYHIVRVIIDAGLIYSVVLIVTLITFCLNLNTQFILVDILQPLIPITFYMIITRLDANARNPSASTHSKVSASAFQTTGVESHGLQLQRIRVDFTQETDAMPVEPSRRSFPKGEWPSDSEA